MHWSRLALAGRLLVALVAALASSGIAAAAAQAVEAPRWIIGGRSLAEGETHFIAMKAYKAFKLVAGNVTVECTAAKLKEGSLLGSSVGNAGKNNEVIEFSTCKVEGKTGGKTIEKCKISEPIVTNHVKSELVETEKAEPEKGSLLTLFAPESGTTFATLKFTTETGGHCPAETKVTGQVAGRVMADPENGELGTLVELGQTQEEAKSWLINFPATPVKKVTRIASGVASELTIKGVEAFSEEAALTGTALLSLAKKNSKGEFEVEEANWEFSIGPELRATRIEGRGGPSTRRCLIKEKSSVSKEYCRLRVESVIGENKITNETLKLVNGGMQEFAYSNGGGKRTERECNVGLVLDPNTLCELEISYVGPANPLAGQYSSEYEVEGEAGGVKTNIATVRVETG